MYMALPELSSQDNLTARLTKFFPPYLSTAIRKPVKVGADTGLQYPIPVTTIPGSVMRDVPGIDVWRETQLLKRRMDVGEVSSPFAFLYGSELSIDDERYLVAPCALGNGEFYQVWGGQELSSGKAVILRIAKNHVSDRVFERDVRNYEIWDKYPELQKVIKTGKTRDGRRLMVLDNGLQTEREWMVEECKELSIDNLYRLVRMQDFAMRRWLRDDAVYFDWQTDNEMVLWKEGVRGQHGMIEAFRVMDWQVEAAYPHEGGREGFGEEISSVRRERRLDYVNKPELRTFLYSNGFIDKETYKVTIKVDDSVFIALDNMRYKPVLRGYDPRSKEDGVRAFFQTKVMDLLRELQMDGVKLNYLDDEVGLDAKLAKLSQLIEMARDIGEDKGLINGEVEVFEGDGGIYCASK